jgi:macrodomain Ter protein organizer (MatP/YcbG family)
MKNALLAARKRSRDYRHAKKKVGVDLTHLAHLRLSMLADDLGKTLSETILIMDEAYLRAEEAGLLEKGW